MNRKQLATLIVGTLVIVLAAAFPPHTQKGRLQVFEPATLDVSNIAVNNQWVFRYVGAAQHEEPGDFQAGELHFTPFYTYEVMKTEWFALIGFGLLLTLLALILFKGPPVTRS